MSDKNIKCVIALVLLLFIMVSIWWYRRTSGWLRTVDPFQNQSSPIPKVVMQTAKTKIPKCFKDKLAPFISGWKYEFFSDNDMFEFIKAHPLPQFPDIINKINSFTAGAHKADMFRYWYLYSKGGVYIDSDLALLRNLDDIVKKYSFVSVQCTWLPNSLFNGFVAVEPLHPIMLTAIEILYNTDNYELTKKYHLTTIQLLDAFNMVNAPNTKLYTERMPDQYVKGECPTVDDDGEIIMNHYFGTKLVPGCNEKIT